jgi:hypothetical protein
VREVAKHRAGFRHLGDLDAALDDAHRPGFEDHEPPGVGAFGEYGLAGAVACERERGKLCLPDFGVVDRRHIVPLFTPSIEDLMPGRPREKYYKRKRICNAATCRRDTPPSQTRLSKIDRHGA